MCPTPKPHKVLEVHLYPLDTGCDEVDLWVAFRLISPFSLFFLYNFVSELQFLSFRRSTSLNCMKKTHEKEGELTSASQKYF